MSGNKQVRLKNGTTEHGPLVHITMHILHDLLDEYSIVLLDAILVARDHTYEPFGDNGEVLKRRNLLQSDGRMHASIRNIILSGSEGEGFDICLINPLAGAK